MIAIYVHGYGQRESVRLQDQAGALLELLRSDTVYPAGSVILEVGCGTGAQTAALALNSQGARIISIDISADSLAQAKARIEAGGIANVEFLKADIFTLPFAPESFDHIFVCFVLEHISRPLDALAILRGLLKADGTITVIEGDHGSAYLHPQSASARVAIACLVELQGAAGGNALSGCELFPLFGKAGFAEVAVSPRMVYVDRSRPELVDGFTKNTFTAMVEGVRETPIAAGLADQETFDKRIKALYRTAEADGVFCYTFFKAVANKARPA